MTRSRERTRRRTILVVASAALVLGASHNTLRDQPAKLGTYIASNLAFNVQYGVATEDRPLLDTLVRRVLSSAGTSDVLGVIVRDARGSVLLQKGHAIDDLPCWPAATLDATEAVTVDGEEVILFRDAVVPTRGAGLAGGVEVAMRKRAIVGKFSDALFPSQHTLREQVIRRGSYIVSNLALNAQYGVATVDKPLLETFLQGVFSSAGGNDVVGAVIRNAKGSVIVQKGDPVKDAPAVDVPRASPAIALSESPALAYKEIDSLTVKGEEVFLFRDVVWLLNEAHWVPQGSVEVAISKRANGLTGP